MQKTTTLQARLEHEKKVQLPAEMFINWLELNISKLITVKKAEKQ